MNEGTPEAPEGFIAFPVRDGFASLVGPLFVHPGRQAIGFRVAARHCNPLGICHGGMMMTVMDMAIGMAVNEAAKSPTFPASINLAYDFLSPAGTGDWLESRVDFTHTTRRTGFANGYLMGPQGPVMRANGICKIPSNANPLWGRTDWNGREDQQNTDE